LLNSDRNAISRLQTPILLLALLGMLAVSCQIAADRKNRQDALGRRLPEATAGDKEDVAREFKFENAQVTPVTNIHYTGKYCSECHETTPLPGADRRLRFGGDYKILCRCHTQTPEVYIHPFDMAPTPAKKERMPRDFPLEDGKVTCLTCHDIYRQCQKRLFERNSLRGAPYARRVDFCYHCHVMEKYAPTDPHRQLNDNHEILIGTCLMCHREKPDEKHATFKEVTLIGDIETLCRRCHHIAGNHSGNEDHMGLVPSPDGLKKIKAVEAKYHTRLPLDENGKMTCITCHNPHAKGVIPENRPGARGAGSRYRHRLPENLCQECHQM
jgi:hypothetical protein